MLLRGAIIAMLASATATSSAATTATSSAKRLLSTTVTSGNAQRYHTCGVVQSVALPGIGPSAGLVRSEQNTATGPPNSLSPICPRCASGSPSDESETCGASGAITIPFNTRSYLLSDFNEEACADVNFGQHEYECVDYDKGSLRLAGRTLAFDVDLSESPCGCNAALYLVSMPQSRESSECHDYCAPFERTTTHPMTLAPRRPTYTFVAGPHCIPSHSHTPQQQHSNTRKQRTWTWIADSPALVRAQTATPITCVA